LNWDNYFIEVCKVISTKSKDPSTKVGCVIVGPDNEIRSTGWNGFPRNVIDNFERYENREFKYQLVAHAELNAICNAARVGTPLNNCKLYTYPLFVCNECAKAIIQVGIKEVIMVNNSKTLPIWIEKSVTTKLMFSEANIRWRIL
jgi:dCMP deaminase